MTICEICQVLQGIYYDEIVTLMESHVASKLCQSL
jgi:hypothetical protein